MKKFLFLALVSLSMISAQAKPGCGNNTTGSPGKKPNPQESAGDPFSALTANDSRDVTDIKLFAGVGEHRLNMTRQTFSRFSASSQSFGMGSYNRHSYQWDMADYGTNSSHQSLMEIVYPEGTEHIFTQISSTQWNAEAGCGDILYQSGTDYTLQLASGYQYHFATINPGTGHYYQMQSFTDTQLNSYTLTYNGSNQVTRVTEPGGRYLSITWAGASDISYGVRQQISLAGMTAPTSGQYLTVALPHPTNSYRYVTFVNQSVNLSEIAEIQVLDGSGNVISATATGTASTGPSTTADKAVDGDPTTYYEASVGSSGLYIDLGPNPPAAATVKILARTGYESQLVANGCYIQQTDIFPSSMPVITQVAASDGRSVTYNYGQVTNSAMAYTFPVLSSVTYPDSTTATYSYSQSAIDTRPLLSDANDPRYSCTFTQIHNDYDSTIIGALIDQKDPSGNVMSTLDSPTSPENSVVTNPTSVGTMAPYYYYAVNGQVWLHKDSLGRSTQFFNGSTSFGTIGFLMRVTDPAGNNTDYTRSTYGNILTETHPDATTETFTRDSLDLPLTIQDERGHTTTYTRDSSHRVTRIDYPDSSYETFTYNSFGEVTSHRMRSGGTETATFDATTGLLQSKTDALSNTTTYSYDSLERPTSITDANNHTTQYAYNDRGQVTLITYPDSTTYSYTYDTYGNKTSETNGLGKTWTYTYDIFSRLLTSTDPLNHATSYTYAGYDTHPLTKTLPSGKVIAYTYDTEWQMLSQTVGYGTADAATTSYTYDSRGNIATMTNPRGKVWTYAYDNRNRRTSVTDPLSHVTSYTYDGDGNVLTVTRPDSGVTTNVYDAMNHLSQTTDPKSEVTGYTYDAAGNLVTMTDSNSKVYTYGYDLLNRKTSLTYPDSSVESYAYDPVGNSATFTTRSSQVQTFSYDTLNRQTGFTWSDSTPAVTRTFDGAGHLLSSANSISTSSYTYDDAGKELSETQDSGTARTVSYTYDNDSNRSSVTYPSGKVVTYDWTNRNQVSDIVDGSTTVASYSYDADGNVAVKEQADGTTATYLYDNADRLVSLNHTLSSASFARFDYGYNSLNDRTYEQRDSGTGDVYSYDADRQVTGVQYNATNPATTPVSATKTVGYTYDNVGNRTAVSDSVVGSTSYTVNNLNQYSAVGATTYGYDGNGNLTSGLLGAGYDAQNRLVSATNLTHSGSLSYDSRNRVVARTIDGTTYQFVYDGWNLIEEYVGGSLSATYIHGVAIDEMICRQPVSGTTVYYHQNAIGSTADLTDGSGSVVEKYSYDVFGKPTIKDASGTVLSATAYGNRFLFTGREWLAKLSLYDYRNRVYSADLGRFLQTDPLRFDAGDVNVYRFCFNRSLVAIDPFGLKTQDKGGLTDQDGYADPNNNPKHSPTDNPQHTGNPPPTDSRPNNNGDTFPKADNTTGPNAPPDKTTVSANVTSNGPGDKSSVSANLSVSSTTSDGTSFNASAGLNSSGGNNNATGSASVTIPIGPK